MVSEVDGLRKRIEKVERENRRMKLLGLVLLAALGVVLVTGLTVEQPVIGAEAFTLVDKDGGLRAVFAMVNSEPTLALFDSTGKVRAGLSVVDNAPRLILYGEDGTPIWAAP